MSGVNPTGSSRKRIRRASIALGVALLLVVGGGAAGVGADTLVTMTAEVSPDQPTTGEEFAVDVHLQSTESSDRNYNVRAVRLYNGTGEDAEQLAEDTSVGGLAPGSERTITLDEVQINETGVHELRAEAVLSSGNTDEVVAVPVTVQVYTPEPLVEVDTESAVADAWRSVNVTVANGLDESVRSVSVSLASDAVQFRDDERVGSAISAGEERTFTFEALPEEPGVHDLDVEITYEDPEGELRSVERTIAADFTQPESPGDVRLTDLNATPTAGGVQVQGTAANVGSQTVDSVVVSVADADGVGPAQTQPEAFVGSLSEDASGAFAVTAALDGERETIPLEVTYVVDGVERTTTTELTYRGPPAVDAIELTEINATPVQTGIQLQGTAANVGNQNVDGVTVTVADAEGVGPAQPTPETFVGSVADGGQGQFTVTASVDGERATIPLEVTYRVDGVERTATVEVPYDGPTSADAIDLTGVSAAPSPDGVEIEGSAANVGNQDVESVVVSVADAEGVSPTAPQPEFFVGEVEQSDFASFTVTADVDGNRTTIPLEVTYLVNGVEYTTTTEVPYEGPGGAAQAGPPGQGPQPDEGGGFSLWLIPVAIVALVALVVGYRRLR